MDIQGIGLGTCLPTVHEFTLLISSFISMQPSFEFVYYKCVIYIISICLISSDSVLKTANTDYKKMGQRIFAFVIGGATRSEVNILVVTLSIER